jgi:hypothetical protein
LRLFPKAIRFLRKAHVEGINLLETASMLLHGAAPLLE